MTDEIIVSADADRLRVCETTIERGLATFIDVGRSWCIMKRTRTIAVVDIRDATVLADQLAAALGGRRHALLLLRQAVEVLEGQQ
jgi:hypothetical protein